ncbi:deoxyuridine 5'-triphosphate nucleotidohydrolase [Cynara cardunculus var. scolymus]|uniref:deoxyuridine 5'-triphosphate nucleotidohydrolase n=1 Tax=Cynara cardunculus var. scolymus TaxID=59895 RepID=UPI000D62FF55|nr:deoxyuridine 5'-triphosphate nucleotidohydrolase [Cynara cardunculus var. scolymus]
MALQLGINMAGTLGAISDALSLAAIFRPYKPYNRLYFHQFRPSLFNCSSKSSFLPLVSAMAENLNGGPEIQEPKRKIRKLEDRSGNELPIFKVKKLSEKAVLPSRGSSLAAGYDLSSATETKVPARGKALVPTDLSIAVPEGTYARIAPRSGLTWKHSIDVGAGVIDADYRGPVGVILFNHSDADFEVKCGDRIAQLIIEKIITPEVMEVDDLDSTERGAGGFGSTGV